MTHQATFRLVTVVSALVGLSIVGSALTVDGRANIFSAGHATAPDPGGGGGGLMAPSVAISGSAYVEISASGLVNCCSAAPNTGPDGGGGGTNINSTGGISGILGPTQMFLVGVFLDASEPSGAGPARLDFSSMGTSFTDLSPLLNQTFWIGDGLTGTGSGSVQKFHAPTGATRLFLGIADSFGFGGDPGWYDDNTGEFEVSVNVVPEPATLCAFAMGAAFLGKLRRRRSAVSS